ncbi:MAG: sigma-70 family RNA polymerase sigma factor [Cyanobacteria bacterium J06576_12]
MGAFPAQKTVLQHMNTPPNNSSGNPSPDDANAKDNDQNEVQDEAQNEAQDEIQSSRLPEALFRLVQETCAEEPGSPKRQRGLTQIIRGLNGRLWHTYDPYYPDALQQTWIYFCRNLCEATTGRVYDPQVARLTTWLNAYLKRRLQDFQIAEIRHRKTTVSSTVRGKDGDGTIDRIDSLVASPDIPPLLEQVRDWATTDADGSLRSLHISKHPTVTAQLLILKRLPPEVSWKTLAVDYGISIGTLSSFYQRKCLPRLRAFGESQGYLGE